MKRLKRAASSSSSARLYPIFPFAGLLITVRRIIALELTIWRKLHVSMVLLLLLLLELALVAHNCVRLYRLVSVSSHRGPLQVNRIAGENMQNIR